MSEIAPLICPRGATQFGAKKRLVQRRSTGAPAAKGSPIIRVTVERNRTFQALPTGAARKGTG